jgi:two-component system phosphate regulon sensor histidine kinase PhoR
MTGRSAMEAFVDARFEQLVLTARDAGSASAEFRVRGPDGPVIVARARRSPVRGLWTVLEDVSELRRLQQIRAEFIDNLSHELRTPLTTISLLGQTLARDADAAGDAVPAKMRDRISKIEVETGHLVQMVNELLDLARIESGGPLALLDDVDLGRVVGESVERLRLFAERQGLRLVVDLPERVPPIRGDEARIGQVVVNLVHNALKFGGEAGDVSVRVREANGEVVTSVEDHGVGVPKADQGRIFERFYKVDRARVRGGGTGLGLSIARHVLAQHGGRIWVESEEGSGSTFSFALPIAPDANSSD